MYVFRFMITFTSCFMMGKSAHWWMTFPKSKAGFSYHLILGPLFWNCPHPGRALPCIIQGNIRCPPLTLKNFQDYCFMMQMMHGALILYMCVWLNFNRFIVLIDHGCPNFKRFVVHTRLLVLFSKMETLEESLQTLKDWV
jgi:hypothetical protein